MAIRVRKLAKELDRSAGEVLGLLHHLGFSRYTKPDDMVNDAVAGKARKAARQGVRAPVVNVEERAPSARRGTAQPAAGDVMAQLVPGVQRQGGARPATPASPPPPTPTAVPPPPPAPSPLPVPPAQRDEPPTPAQAEALALAEAKVASLQAELAQRDEEMEALRATLAEAPDGLAVSELLRERGLRGPDENDRAMEALAGARQLAAVLVEARLGPEASVRLRKALEGMLLLDGSPPDELSVPAVAVSPERADAPGAETLGRLCGKLGEQLLLSGFRRLRFVGVGPRWHEPVRARLDRRIEVDFRPGGPRDAARITGDAEGVDLVLYVGVEVGEVPQDLPARVVDGGGELARALETAVQSLAAAP